MGGAPRTEFRSDLPLASGYGLPPTAPGYDGLVCLPTTSRNDPVKLSKTELAQAVAVSLTLDEGLKSAERAIGKPQRQMPLPGSTVFWENYRTPGFLGGARKFNPEDKNFLFITTSCDAHYAMADISRGYFAKIGKRYPVENVTWEVYDCSQLFRTLEPLVKVWQYSISGMLT